MGFGKSSQGTMANTADYSHKRVEVLKLPQMLIKKAIRS